MAGSSGHDVDQRGLVAAQREGGVAQPHGVHQRGGARDVRELVSRPFRQAVLQQLLRLSNVQSKLVPTPKRHIGPMLGDASVIKTSGKIF